MTKLVDPLDLAGRDERSTTERVYKERKDDERIDRIEQRLAKLERLIYLALGGLGVIAWLVQHFGGAIETALLK